MQQTKNLYSQIISTVHSENKIPVRVLKTDAGVILVSCTNSDDVKKMNNILHSKLHTDSSIEIEQLKNPTVKVLDVDVEMSNEQLEKDINLGNFSTFKDGCKVIHTVESSTTNLKTVLLEISPELHAHIVTNNYQLYVGHQRCRVMHKLNITICYKCGKFNHGAKKCDSESTICINCGGNHPIDKCKNSVIKKCINCLARNIKYNTQYNTDHLITDVRCYRC